MNNNIPVATTKKKFFIFSDESGSWHDPQDVYVRSWVVVSEKGHNSMCNAIDYANTDIGCREMKWATLAGNKKHFDIIDKFAFKVFLTISSPSDIHWEQKYRLTRNFQSSIDSIDFGAIDAELVAILKKKMFDDICNVLFLNFYERTHIENAKEAIQGVLPGEDNLLIYRVDPPQMSKDGWRNILLELDPDVKIEFPKSECDAGIQFADIIAGCVRSFLIRDKNTQDSATSFLRKIRIQLVKKSRANPNPNLIFFDEINEALKQRSAEIWTI